MDDEDFGDDQDIRNVDDDDDDDDGADDDKDLSYSSQSQHKVETADSLYERYKDISSTDQVSGYIQSYTQQPQHSNTGHKVS